jgi:hypothetical protein
MKDLALAYAIKRKAAGKSFVAPKAEVEGDKPKSEPMRLLTPEKIVAAVRASKVAPKEPELDLSAFEEEDPMAALEMPKEEEAPAHDRMRSRISSIFSGL